MRTIFQNAVPAVLVTAFLSTGALAQTVDAPAQIVPAQIVPAQVVIERLDAALAGRDAPASREIVLDSPIVSPPKNMSLETMHLDSLTFEARSGRLMAVFAPSEGKERLRISGRVYQLVDVIVPAREIDAGETITDRDLESAKVRRDPAAQEPLTDPAALIGKTPRHALRAHEAVHITDLQVPIVVHRGDLVTMTLQMPLMTISAQGQALGDAAEGAAIRVSNSKSNRVVEGVVTGPGTVAIEAPPVQ